MSTFDSYVLDYETSVDPRLQEELVELDALLRVRHGMSEEHTALGLLDLRALRLAMIRPDREEYAASVAKIAILLAYFEHRREVPIPVDPQTRYDLGRMIKSSSNELAAHFSRELGLAQIQQILNAYRFYDPRRGGGIWMGKHYGDDSERIGDPIGDNSHAATVRQLLRFYLLLEQGRLVSQQASAVMRDIFASPDIPQDEIKFAKGVQGRGVSLRRKWGSWEDWLHDTAVITGPGRHYILVGLTHHGGGDQYLEDLALAVDILLTP
jgi:beta-lactamase class A